MTKNIQHDATFNFQKISTPNFDPYTNAPSLHNEKNQYSIATGLESVAKLISKTQSFNAFKYMASYVRIENAIQPSITLGAIRIFFWNLQGL